VQATRDSFPDVLRGFALLGIAIVNIQYFAVDSSIGFEAAAQTPANDFANAFVVLLFQSKFFLLFSFLFGYSSSYVVGIQRMNSSRWLGRAIGLILLGILHFLLLFHGDILFVYGLFAIALIPFLFRDVDYLQRLAKRILISFGAILLTLSLLAIAGEQFPGQNSATFDVADGSPSTLNSTLADGTFWAAIAPRFEQWLDYIFLAILIQGPLIFAAFLLGLAVSKRKGLGSGANPAIMLRLAKWGIGIGLPLQLVSVLLFWVVWHSDPRPIGLELLALSLNYATAPVLAAGYLGLLWMVSERFSRLSLLAAAGRHSLTIYLMQSAVFAALFSSWGAGLFGALEPPELIALAAISWLLLSLLALLNLRLSGRGPLEILLSRFSKLFQRRAG